MRRKWTDAAVFLFFMQCSSIFCAPTSVHLPATSAGPMTAKKGILAEMDGIVAVIPAGGPHNEMAMRASRHWRKVRFMKGLLLVLPALLQLALQ